MQKTLGGDRLGSGKKMKVDLHGYERSTHNLSYIWRSTMASGTLVPFMSQVALPGDTFDINLDVDIKTHPTIGPLFGSYKIQLDLFQAPIRLYNALLHNNALGIGMNMANVKLPVIEMTAPSMTSFPDDIDIDNSQINPSSLLAYLGLRGIGFNGSDDPETRTFNAIPILAYWEIFKQYYSNKMEDEAYVIHTPSEAIIQTVDKIDIVRDTTVELPETPSSGSITLISGSTFRIYYTGTQPLPHQIMINTIEHGLKSIDELSVGVWNAATGYIWSPFRWTTWGNTQATQWSYRDDQNLNTGKPSIDSFNLENIDDMRQAILASYTPGTVFKINDVDVPPYKWLYGIENSIPNILSSQEGLALKTYQSDLFNNWLNTELIDGTNGITAVTAIDTSAGSFTLDTLNLSKKVYDMLNRIAVSGGTYDDWLDAVYAHDRYQRCESPMYMGGLIRELVFQEVVSNSQSENQPLGTLAGKGIMAQKKKGGNAIIKVDEPSYLLGIISLTPRIDFSQGNNWDLNLQTLDDLHKPQLDEIGFQELITEQMAWWDTRVTAPGVFTQKSAGKQPAWINYMTNVNKTYGNFAIANNEMFMTLNRRYEFDSVNGIEDLTTYIDPSKFNFIFAETALDAQNFWAQIAVDITARRKMSAKVMPNL